MNKEPRIVVDSILDGTEAKRDVRINVYPVSIRRYALLEKLNSPFLNVEVGFDINGIIPSAYVFCSDSNTLRKYTSADVTKLVDDAFDWAEDSLSLDDVPELIRNVTGQMQKLSEAAPDEAPKKETAAEK